MNEFEKNMGINWGDRGQIDYGDIQPMEALDQFYTMFVTIGLENIPENPRMERSMNILAKMEEADLISWANKMASDYLNDTEKSKKVLFYLEQAHNFQNICRRYFGGKNKKESIN